MSDIELGDIGRVEGRAGLFCVCGGAHLPSNIEACSVSAKRAAEVADVLSVTNGHETFMCWRGEFAPLAWTQSVEDID